MSFGSFEFLAVFLPLMLVVHWVLPRRSAIQNTLLLGCSYVFYATWDPILLSAMVATTLINFGAVRWMDQSRASSIRLRVGFWLAVVYNVGQLIVFKYLGFFADSLNTLIGQDHLLPVLRLAMPLGISFWTLQHIGYLIDIYYDRDDRRPTLLEFSVFASFFPQVVSGPIPRGRELLPQLAEPRKLTADNVAAGARTFLVGYMLKYFVADNLGMHLVDPVFSASDDYSAIGHWLALLGYTGQIFGDFAGYSIMALGAGRLFGIELPINFEFPFFSKNMMEYWRRWHITLNRWLFDYLYGPLLTTRGFFRGRADLGFMLVFALSGLWHGATWNFVIWGAVHGVALAVHRRYDVFYRGLCRKDRVWVKRRKSTGYLAVAWFTTNLFFVLTLIPFRTPDLAGMKSFVAGMFRMSGTHHPLGTGPVATIAVLGAFAFLIGHHLSGLAWGQALRKRLLALPAPVRGVAYGLVIVFLLIFVPVGAGTFIYAQF